VLAVNLILVLLGGVLQCRLRCFRVQPPSPEVGSDYWLSEVQVLLLAAGVVVLSVLICRTAAQSVQVCILQLVESSARRILGWLPQVVLQ
jgi:hypothetical protein